jgi:predicted KAP-like P-loop ATPase
MAEVNWIAVKGILEENLKKSLTDVLEGSKDDIKNFIMQISNDLLIAAKEKRQDLVKELFEQLEMIAEKNKIVATKKTLEAVLNIIKTVAFKGIL